jgi:long-chain acyl-CoA synthetase
LTMRHDNLLDLLRAVVARAADATALIYFDRLMSYRELDETSEAFAAWLLDQGVVPGDRVAIMLQNDPQFLIALVATWKLGAIAVPMNPMYRGEIKKLLTDCRPRIVLCYAQDFDNVKPAVDGVLPDVVIVVASPWSFQSRDDIRVLPVRGAPQQACWNLDAAIQEGRERTVPRVSLTADSPALILYTSGTTGLPKGAVARHYSLAFNGSALVQWCGLHSGTRILAIAPLFHITGVVCHIAAAFAAGCSLVLNYRFEASSVLEAIRATRPTFTIGSITAFIALMNAPGACPEDFLSFESIYSGGAPIAPSVRSEFKERTGKLIHNCYGMTETAAPTHLSPLGVEAPVDPSSGALSIGIPIYDTDAFVLSDDGKPAPPGTPGELCTKGPQIMLGYWNMPEETAAALHGGWMHTGDIAVMDERGWFYLVDRKKDMIVASGFKVWPREVEDVLYMHPAVREAAVVGAPDRYRGETVKAYVSLKAGCQIDGNELIRHCRANLASYKAPTIVEILDELPKTATGKIQRNVLRELTKQEAGG